MALIGRKETGGGGGVGGGLGRERRGALATKARIPLFYSIRIWSENVDLSTQITWAQEECKYKNKCGECRSFRLLFDINQILSNAKSLLASPVEEGFYITNFSSFESNCRDHLHISSDRRLNIQVVTSAGHNRAHRSLDNTTAGLNHQNLIPLRRLAHSTRPKKSLAFGNVNAGSIRHQTEVFMDHITGNKIDVCTVTETWLRDEDSVVLAALSPQGLCIKRSWPPG